MRASNWWNNFHFWFNYPFKEHVFIRRLHNTCSCLHFNSLTTFNLTCHDGTLSARHDATAKDHSIWMCNCSGVSLMCPLKHAASTLIKAPHLQHLIYIYFFFHLNHGQVIKQATIVTHPSCKRTKTENRQDLWFKTKKVAVSLPRTQALNLADTLGSKIIGIFQPIMQSVSRWQSTDLGTTSRCQSEGLGRKREREKEGV